MPFVKPSKKALICLVSIAVLILIGCGFMYANRASRLAVLEKQIADKQQRLADGEQVARRLSDVERRYEDAQVTLGILEQGVSTKAYVPTLLRQLEETGKSVNLRVTGVRPKPAERVARVPNQAESGAETDTATNTEAKKAEEPPYDKLDLDIQLSGKYWDVVRFLSKITSFPKIITVNDMQISTEGQPTGLGSPELMVKINATAFILKEPARSDTKRTERRADAGGAQS